MCETLMNGVQDLLAYMDILTRGWGLWVSSKKESWLSFMGLPAGGFTRLGATCVFQQWLRYQNQSQTSDHSAV